MFKVASHALIVNMCAHYTEQNRWRKPSLKLPPLELDDPACVSDCPELLLLIQAQIDLLVTLPKLLIGDHGAVARAISRIKTA